jgi:hypothetical protein
MRTHPTLSNSEVAHDARRVLKRIDKLVLITPTGETRNTLTNASIIINELIVRLPK